MGIYNCEETLPEAIQSIINQTYTDWELIMCDDGSTDNTYPLALSFRDKYPNKIKVLKNEKNIGLNATLNHCLQHASGKYIARMDGDDLCDAHRFEIELETLEKETNLAIVSTDVISFDEFGTWGHISYPEYPDNQYLIHGTPYSHAPCMVRRDAYDAVGGYSVSKWLLRVEDYHLWFKMHKAGYRGKNIKKALYHMRDDRNAYHRRKFRYRINEAYVKCIIVKELNLPVWEYIYALRPIVVGLLPNVLYDRLHKKRLKG